MRPRSEALGRGAAGDDTALRARGHGLFVAEPGKNAEETLRAPLALEVTEPPRGTAGRGSLFLDDGESAAGARFVLDVALEHVDGRLCIRFGRAADGFVPAQRDLEIRVARGYASLTVDGERRRLALRDLASWDRTAVVSVARVPLGAREVLI